MCQVWGSYANWVIKSILPSLNDTFLCVQIRYSFSCSTHTVQPIHSFQIKTLFKHQAEWWKKIFLITTVFLLEEDKKIPLFTQSWSDSKFNFAPLEKRGANFWIRRTRSCKMTRCFDAASRFICLLYMDHHNRPTSAPCVWKTWKSTCCQMSLGNESEVNFLAKTFVMTSHSQDCLVN